MYYYCIPSDPHDDSAAPPCCSPRLDLPCPRRSFPLRMFPFVLLSSWSCRSFLHLPVIACHETPSIATLFDFASAVALRLLFIFCFQSEHRTLFTYNPVRSVACRALTLAFPLLFFPPSTSTLLSLHSVNCPYHPDSMYKYPKHCLAERQATVAPLVSPFVYVRFRATIAHSLTCLHSSVCSSSLAVRYRLYPSPLAKPSANPYIPLSSSPVNPSTFRSSRTHTSGGGDNKSRSPPSSTPLCVLTSGLGSVTVVLLYSRPSQTHT